MEYDLSAAITGVVCSGLHFGHQLFLAFRKFLADRVKVHFCGYELRKKLLFLFLDVVLSLLR
jgi:hypothetical protein